jgi:hypothetical protein
LMPMLSSVSRSRVLKTWLCGRKLWLQNNRCVTIFALAGHRSWRETGLCHCRTAVNLLALQRHCTQNKRNSPDLILRWVLCF